MEPLGKAYEQLQLGHANRPWEAQSAGERMLMYQAAAPTAPSVSMASMVARTSAQLQDVQARPGPPFASFCGLLHDSRLYGPMIHRCWSPWQESGSPQRPPKSSRAAGVSHLRRAW